MRGKPIEFRRYLHYAPELGTKWICPICGTEYFAIWRRSNENEWADGRGRFTLDLSYYESYSDEHDDEPGEKPAYLCEDNAEDVLWHWGFTGRTDDTAY
jgi:hypothetical protein